MTTKRCFRCLCDKPADAFYMHPRMADGRLGKCKECTKADALKYRQENLEKVRSYDRARGSMPHRVAARAEYAKTQAYAQSHKAAAERWSAKHPERRRAAIAVNNAVRDGVLRRDPCHVCGLCVVHGHHADYSRPLDVVWLCPTHHKQAHAIAEYV